MKQLIEALRNGRQADPDGLMVVISRQACEEAADALERRELSIEAATAAERKLCAEIADRHKGSAAQRRPKLGEFFNASMSEEIRAEERGENIAAEMIATAIRARGESGAFGVREEPIRETITFTFTNEAQQRRFHERLAKDEALADAVESERRRLLDIAAGLISTPAYNAFERRAVDTPMRPTKTDQTGH